MSVINIILTGKNICRFLLDVIAGKKTAMANIGVMFAGSMNLDSKIQPSNNPALLKNSLMLVFIAIFLSMSMI